MTRARAALGRFSPAQWVLAGLLAAGTALRIVALASYWPVVTNLSDSTAYARFAQSDVLANPQHPAGYSTFLAVLGWVTHQVAVVTVLQHVFGIATALLFYLAVRRLAGSPWPGLIPAGVILLNSDQIFLEQNVMAETLFGLFLGGAFYSAVRALDAPNPWWRWPLAAGALTAIGAVVRTEGLFLVPVMFLFLLLARPRPWRGRLAAPLAMLVCSAVILLAYAVTNDVHNGRFEVGPSTGWHLYGRVAPFADCKQFTPPKGTAALCHASPPGGRAGNDWYIYIPGSPAVDTFGHLGLQDGKLRAFAMQVIEHQPLTYAKAVFRDVRTFFVPDTRHNPPPYAGPGLSTELDWTRVVPQPTLGEIRDQMEVFFDHFRVHESSSGARFLQDYEHPFRFGGTLLTLCSLLTALGLLIGDRRVRAGAFLFGIGGLAMLVLSMFGAWYVGRYSVPIAAPVAAGASMTLFSLVGVERSRRQSLATRPAAAPGHVAQ